MGTPTKEERDAFAKALEAAAVQVRNPYGGIVEIKMNTRRPIEADTDNSRFRRTGSYTFSCIIGLQFPPGEWVDYGDKTEAEAP